MKSRPLNSVLKQKLEVLSWRKRTQLARPVWIKDIIVCQQSESLEHDLPIGEFNLDLTSPATVFARAPHKESENALILRMLSHINALSLKALNVHYQENYYAVEGALKSEKKLAPFRENHITRLITPEFSFYPHHLKGALSIKGFRQLLDGIEHSVTGFPDNLHLILASFPLKTENKQVQNVVLMVECGEQTKIHVFAKAYPFYNDPNYRGTLSPHYSSDKKRIKNPALVQTMALASEQELQNGNSLHITYSGNILCKTQGGAVFKTVIEVCLDHKMMVAKSGLKKALLDSSAHAGVLHPQFVSHVVVSNTVKLQEAYLIGESFSHADAKKDDCKIGRFSKKSTTLALPLSQEVSQTAFGPPIVWLEFPVTQLSPYIDVLAKEIGQANLLIGDLEVFRQYQKQRPQDYLAVYEATIEYLKQWLIKAIAPIISAACKSVLRSLVEPSLLMIRAADNSIQLIKAIHILQNEELYNSELYALLAKAILLLKKESYRFIDYLYTMNISSLEVEGSASYLMILSTLVNHSSMLERLLRANKLSAANIYSEEDNILYFAVSQDSIESLECLLAHFRYSASSLQKELLTAIEFKQLEAFIFIANKLPVALKASLRAFLLKHTRLMIMMGKTGLPFVAFILKRYPALSTSQDDCGETLMHCAVYSRNTEAALLLMQNNIDLSLMDSKGTKVQDLVVEMFNLVLFKKIYVFLPDKYVFAQQYILKCLSLDLSRQLKKTIDFCQDDAEPIVALLDDERRLRLLTNVLNPHFVTACLAYLSPETIITFIKTNKANAEFFKNIEKFHFQPFSQPLKTIITQAAIGIVGGLPYQWHKHFYAKIYRDFIPYAQLSPRYLMGFYACLLKRQARFLRVQKYQETPVISFARLFAQIESVLSSRPEVDRPDLTAVLMVIKQLIEDKQLSVYEVNGLLHCLYHYMWLDQTPGNDKLEHVLMQVWPIIVTGSESVELALHFLTFFVEENKLLYIDVNDFLPDVLRLKRTQLIRYLYDQGTKQYLQTTNQEVAFLACVHEQSYEMFKVLHTLNRDKQEFFNHFVGNLQGKNIILMEKLGEDFPEHVEPYLSILMPQSQIALLSQAIGRVFYNKILLNVGHNIIFHLMTHLRIDTFIEQVDTAFLTSLDSEALECIALKAHSHMLYLANSVRPYSPSFVKAYSRHIALKQYISSAQLFVCYNSFLISASVDAMAKAYVCEPSSDISFFNLMNVFLDRADLSQLTLQMVALFLKGLANIIGDLSAFYDQITTILRKINNFFPTCSQTEPEFLQVLELMAQNRLEVLNEQICNKGGEWHTFFSKRSIKSVIEHQFIISMEGEGSAIDKALVIHAFLEDIINDNKNLPIRKWCVELVEAIRFVKELSPSVNKLVLESPAQAAKMIA